jgi:hypothetical protein
LDKENRLKTKLICFWILLLTSALIAQTRIVVHESGSVLWNLGWGERFYFQHGSLQDLLNGTFGESHVLRNFVGPNPELWVVHTLSRHWDMGVGFKYQQLQFSLQDSVSPSWVDWRKRLDADLKFYTVSVKGAYAGKTTSLYAKADIGACHGSVMTWDVITASGIDTSAIRVDGSQSGMVWGGGIGVTERISSSISCFLEGCYLGALHWKPWPSSEVSGRMGGMDGVGEEDRKLVLQAFQLSFGVQIEVFSF